MGNRLGYNIMARPEDIPPSMDGFEVLGVFNPGVCRYKGKYLLLLRVAEIPKNRKSYLLYSPRLEIKNGNVTDVKVDTYRLGVDGIQEDPRGLNIFRCNGTGRLTSISHFRLAISSDGKAIDYISPGPAIPFTECEEYGKEDARIVPINGDFIVSSVAVSRKGIFTLFRKTQDFKSFEKRWRVGSNEYKDTLPFPEKINDEYAILTRPNGKSGEHKINIAFSKDLCSLEREKPLMDCREGGFDSLGMGEGSPPIKTKEGWLGIYHGVQKRNNERDVPLEGVYQCGNVLMDLDDPTLVKARSREPFFEPCTDWLIEKFKDYTVNPDVVFVSGAVLEGDLVRVFGGLDDQFTFSAEVLLKDLFESMEYYKEPAMAC